MRPDNPKQFVAHGYDQIAEAYLAARDAASPDGPLAQLIAALPPGAPVLDLGCGAGVPVAQQLAARFAVTGVDISARQLALARAHVPTGRFLQADMTTVEFPAASFAAVVACYSIIHVPREEQGALVARICSWLSPGGLFLATWAVEAWEGEEEFHGGRMWWSHYDPDTSLDLLRAAGFEIAATHLDEGEDETWLWVTARKPGRSETE